MQKALKKYLKKRESGILLLLHAPRAKYTPGAFHKLRVEIKKLNALCELTAFCDKDFRRKRTLKPFRKLFTKAGKVRELQIEELLMKKYFGPASFKNYRSRLRRDRLNARKDFFFCLDKTSAPRLKKKFHVIGTSLKYIEYRKVNHYLKREKNQIQKLLAGKNLQTAQLHKLRKLLKTYYYNWMSLFPEKKNTMPLKKDPLPRLLGFWHDCQTAIAHLERVTNKPEPEPAELDEIRKIKNRFNSESRLVRGKIKKAMLRPHSGFPGTR